MQNKKSREWAIENNRFSLKVDGGYWTHEGEFIKVPAGVARFYSVYKSKYGISRYGGWTLGNLGKASKFKKEDYFFTDAKYGDWRASLKAAIAKNTQYRNENVLQMGRKLNQVPRSDRKKNPAKVGVWWMERETLTRGIAFDFLVSAGRIRRKYVAGYNLDVNSPQFLEEIKKAEALRDSLCQEYCELYRCSSVSSAASESTQHT